MPRKPDGRRIESRRIESLQPYHLQAEMFGDLSQPELQALAADIKKNGLLQPIEVLPSGTVIAGHQRLRAVTLLGWDKVDCWLRHDLAEQGDAGAEGEQAKGPDEDSHPANLARAPASVEWLSANRVRWSPLSRARQGAS